MATSARRDVRPESLWRLTVPVVVWLLHFSAVYATATVACGRWAASGAAPRGVVVACTAAALVALAASLRFGTRGRAALSPARALDDDAPHDRDAFVATTNALLVLASGVAIVAMAAAAMVVPTCR